MPFSHLYFFHKQWKALFLENEYMREELPGTYLENKWTPPENEDGGPRWPWTILTEEKHCTMWLNKRSLKYSVTEM